MSFANRNPSPINESIGLLSAPFLQLPTEKTVKVVWFTEFVGENHLVKYGEQPRAIAKRQNNKTD